MTDFEAKLHWTWVQYLVEAGHRELASAMLDATLSMLQSGFDFHGIAIDIPVSAYPLIQADQGVKATLRNTLELMSAGYISDQNGNDIGNPTIEFRVKLMEVDEDWKAVVRDLIVNRKDGNQGVVSSLMASKRNESPITYNEMRFASKSEVRIAQEFEKRRVLFFPLPLAVRAETGHLYKDHREADFLVCDDGVWGILEVSYHPDRFEKDAEKDAWFKKSGVLCVEHRSAERCFNQPSEVVEEFLAVLARHKR